MTNAKPSRSRNAAATREAILQSAFEAFAQSGYDGVGVRVIAGNAGVTAMLVNRYFGSKEALFAEVVERAMLTPSVMKDDNIRSDHFDHAVAVALVERTATGSPPLDGMRIILNSASNPRAAEIIRQKMEAHHQRLVSSVVHADHAPQRAALVLATVAGFQLMRQLIGLKALNDIEPSILAELLAPILSAAVGGRDPP